MPKIITQDQVLAKAKQVHPDYDYSLFVYNGMTSKSTVICAKHGPFTQDVYSHLKGCGCPKCKIDTVAEKRRITPEEFFAKAKQVHPAYDYSRTVFSGMREKIIANCPVHGEFEQQAYVHVNGQGCPSCGREKLAEQFRFSESEFILKAKAVHAGKGYEYPGLVYKNNNQIISIRCPVHGVFQQKVAGHLSGDGCQKCSGHHRHSTDEFVAKAIEKHGNIYDYSHAVYESYSVPAEIICAKHGIFSQKPGDHLQGRGCPKCAGNQGYTHNEFLAAASKIHKGAYDYSKVVYKLAVSPVTIICRTHGEFSQKPGDHLQGRGCWKCHLDRIRLRKLIPYAEIIARAKAIHTESGYIYPPEPHGYAGKNSKITITCQKHGPFIQTLDNHIYAKAGCPSCAYQVSHAETDIFQLIKSTGLEAEQRNRTIIKPFELDIVVPSLNLGIEYNGMRWHTCEPGEHILKDYEKWQKAKNAGYQLLVIWEYDWHNRKDVIKHWLLHKLGKASRLCGARQTKVGFPAHKETSAFYEHYHLQGACSPGWNIGLRYKDRWIAMATFTKSAERGVRLPKNEFYFARLAFAGQVPGGASKLFSEAIRSLNPSKIHAHSDNSYADGGVKKKLGFTPLEDLKPRYRIWHPDFGIQHRTFWQKKNIPKRLAELGIDAKFDAKSQTTLDGHRLCGCRHIWDCGKRRWVWTA